MTGGYPFQGTVTTASNAVVTSVQSAPTLRVKWSTTINNNGSWLVKNPQNQWVNQFNYDDWVSEDEPRRRKLPPLNFNRYINASDLMEEFIAFLGTEGVRQGEVMEIPVGLFIKWLIIRACEEDEEEPNVTLELPAPKSQPRCLGCQQWMSYDVLLPMHGQRCANRYYQRELAA